MLLYAVLVHAVPYLKYAIIPYFMFVHIPGSFPLNFILSIILNILETYYL